MQQAATDHPGSRAEHTTERIAEELYQQHHDRLLALARRNTSSADDAEEALHDAFLLFIHHYDVSDGSPPIAWLTLTLKRRCWAIYKAQRRVALAPPPRSADEESEDDLLEQIPDSGQLPDEAAEQAETVALVRRQLARLKPAERRALALLALGYSYKEIVKITGWTYTKVNRCIREGRATLRSAA